MALLAVSLVSSLLLFLSLSPLFTPQAFSEHVPVVHIVGTPNTLHLKTKPMLHHTLGDGRFVNRVRTERSLVTLTTCSGLMRTKKPPSNSPFLRPTSSEKRTPTSRSTAF